MVDLILFQMATDSIDYEGPDLGVGDFVLLSQITMDAFVENLKLRFDIDLPSTFQTTLFLF